MGVYLKERAEACTAFLEMAAITEKSAAGLDGSARDSEFANSLLQTSSLHSELRCGPSRAGHNPVGPLQGFEDPLAFRFLQGVAK